MLASLSTASGYVNFVPLVLLSIHACCIRCLPLSVLFYVYFAAFLLSLLYSHVGIRSFIFFPSSFVLIRFCSDALAIVL